MAGRPQNRLELRRQYEAAEPLDPVEDETEEVGVEVDDEEKERRPKKKKAPAKSKAKTKAVKPTARMRIVWAVVNDAFKTVATFEYAQKEAAQARADELIAKGKGTHFLQKVKEEMPADAPGLGAVIPRTPPAVVAAPTVEEEEETVDEEEIDTEDEVEIEEEDED